MSTDRIKEIEDKIADLKARWPAHSVPPSMWQKLEELEEELEEASKVALVDYKKCRPEECDSGVCAAALACSHKLLRQEAPYDIPMTDPFLCQGCGDCVRACPLKAIKIARM